MRRFKRTALFSEYRKLHAKIINFGEWELPVQFSSIIQEHECTRKNASLFDVSHMGEIIVYGNDSLHFLQMLVTNDVSTLTPNKVQYGLMCNELGGTIDDFLIYMIANNHYMLVVNAVNIEKNVTWMNKHKAKFQDVTIRDDSEKFALLALQGPQAEKILQKITTENMNEIKYFSFKQNVPLTECNIDAIISRTGYTGEDGFELYLNSSDSVKVWNVLLQIGKEEKINPAGLGARDTLRLEAGLPLYGQELSETISPIEAGLTFAVKIRKGTNFIGKEALQQQMNKGVRRKIVGIEMIDNGIPRTNYIVLSETGIEIGKITSGTMAPTLRKNVGFALIDATYSNIGEIIFVQVRKRRLKAKIVQTPFYQRTK